MWHTTAQEFDPRAAGLSWDRDQGVNGSSFKEGCRDVRPAVN